jgi:hypothetical protein
MWLVDPLVLSFDPSPHHHLIYLTKIERWLHECNYSPDVRFRVSVRPEGIRVNCLRGTSISPLCVIMVLAAHRSLYFQVSDMRNDFQ